MHICNNKGLFLNLKKPGKLGPVRTGGGLVILYSIGFIKVEFLIGYKKGIAQYNTINLKEVLYIPGFLLNIVSSYRLYALGNTLIK